MIILFDTCGFSHLVQQPQWQDDFARLKGLIAEGKVTVVGSCTMLYELVPISLNDRSLYYKMLAEYEELIGNKIVNESRTLFLREAERLGPIDLSAALLDEMTAAGVLRGFKDPTNFDGLECEAKSLKKGYADVMEESYLEVVAERLSAGDAAKSLRGQFESWFGDFDREIEVWFRDMFKLEAQNVKVDSLPHVSAFLGYALTRVYERAYSGIKDHDNDWFDRAHFTDATVVDVLVTDDKPFRRTALMVPTRTFDVKTLSQLSAVINELAS